MRFFFVEYMYTYQSSQKCFRNFRILYLFHRKIKFSICGKCSENKIGDEENNDQSIPENGHDSEFIDKNYNKVPLGDFTLEEYAEKVILYGFLMVSLTI